MKDSKTKDNFDDTQMQDDDTEKEFELKKIDPENYIT